jgi:hypothetical protein
MNDDTSIRRMRWLLDQRGNAYVSEDRLHEVLAIQENKRPDFYVDTGRGVRFLAEVKAFDKPTVLDESSEFVGAMFIGDSFQQRIGSAIEHASKQLARYRHSGFPLVVIIDNHRQRGIPLGRVELVQILGSLEYEFTVDSSTGKTLSEEWVHSRDDYAMGDRRRTRPLKLLPLQLLAEAGTEVDSIRMMKSPQKSLARSEATLADVV